MSEIPLAYGQNYQENSGVLFALDLEGRQQNTDSDKSLSKLKSSVVLEE